MTQNSKETQIRALVDRWARAVRAKDMDGVLANHTDDIVMFDVPMPLQSTGMEEYKKTWDLFFDYNRGGPGSFDVTDLRITAGESVAFCHAFLKIFDSTARVTIGLRKEKGRWLVSHEHHSYPIELESAQ
ncbi:MAG: YybH family protein [Woeseiaceae bacterium]